MKRRGQRRAEYFSKMNRPLMLEIGPGGAARPGFIGIDLHRKSDICWDLEWGLPFHENVVSEIRSDHCLEHLELQTVIRVLVECHRVLKPGGILDFTVPHFNPFIDAYLRHDFLFFEKQIYDVPPGQEEIYNTCFDRLAWLLLRNGEHKSIFDSSSIVAKVELAGFSHVTTRKFDPKCDLNQRFSSIYVRAIK